METVIGVEKALELLEAGWWWITEPNPECLGWCTADHVVSEFADSAGSFLCTATVGRVAIASSAVAEVERPGEVDRLPAGLLVADPDEIAPAEVEALCADLQAAAALVNGETL
ncbi:hypothetical protein [Nocardioides marmorisolisilvae]|uniref:Uncharacterized protein n=1 Tax=Nocardioides marmorisolisilvae TaxID=1542737 RepID=A0A3N0DU48_9ACTN|nr:hypothetical protein [Nocardioides marmorisolisilvae]RNL79157.1 hypothetical protein EFL95_09005 [Nocardioides marmorisolisilvae]